MSTNNLYRLTLIHGINPHKLGRKAQKTGKELLYHYGVQRVHNSQSETQKNSEVKKKRMLSITLVIEYITGPR